MLILLILVATDASAYVSKTTPRGAYVSKNYTTWRLIRTFYTIVLGEPLNLKEPQERILVNRNILARKA